MRYTIEQQWNKGDIDELYHNMMKIDRKESFFYTNNLKGHLRDLQPELKDNLIRITNSKGQLMMLGGIVQSKHKATSGVVWLLRTKCCVFKSKIEKKEFSKIIDLVISMVVNAGFKRIGNIVWNKQISSIKSLIYYGFDMNKDPVALFDPMGNCGLFYKFWGDI